MSTSASEAGGIGPIIAPPNGSPRASTKPAAAGGAGPRPPPRLLRGDDRPVPVGRGPRGPAPAGPAHRSHPLPGLGGPLELLAAARVLPAAEPRVPRPRPLALLPLQRQRRP